MDTKFYGDYKNLTSERYFTVSLETIPEGKVWYIPHHGVYCPSKLRKIRVVFDGSAEFHQQRSCKWSRFNKPIYWYFVCIHLYARRGVYIVSVFAIFKFKI